ncbi:transposase [Cucumis melo var. makuwa]|uniref:Transposase n=1 Tax=Cucumis melo var. makuwa TaxID=1194695 RepID=A0A5A7VE14_CUCMM|nr:transposase [Cucumis melo var. makuwa]
MDKSWMMENRMFREYELRVEAFIQFGFRNGKGSSTIRCPCLKCRNRLSQDESTVRYHLYANGIDQRFTKLSALVRLYNLKVRFGWSNASFFELLATISELLPENNKMSISIKDLADISRCPKCNISRWKTSKNSNEEIKGVAAKQLWYFSIVSRFLRMFKNSEYAKNLCWHANDRKVNGVLRHPADTPSWRLVDHLWPDFGSEPRNLCLGLSTDDINPYGDLSMKYSCWHVIATIYNLPPWLCIRRKYLILTMLISGPKQPRYDINVYLAPLIDDLKLMWEEGVQCFNAHRNEIFTMRAVLLWTINDFHAYGNLYGCSVKGYKACPICGEETSSIRLPHGKKNAYMGHRKYLPSHHPYRRQKKAFDGNQEHGTPPLPLSGETIYNRLKDKTFPCGKRSSRRLNEDIPNDYWKRISAFYELAYWKKLHVRHYLNVMHIEKNVLMNIIGTLLDIPGKRKDGLSARLDLVEMNIRPELAPVSDESRTYIPAACYTLSREEKISICRTLSDLKVPEGYSSNFKSLVSLENLMLFGLKSHDCHVLMQQLLPIAICGVLPNNVRVVITRLCSFFNAICSKTLRISDLDKLQQDVVETLCLLEKYFPPSFFTIMVHLCFHLVREAKICGPIYLRWMYPFERYMKVLKSYVRNRNRPEGSIAEAHICEEAVEFCSEFLSGLDPIGLDSFKSREEGRIERPLSVGSSITPSQVVLKQAHLHILENIEEVQPYRERHMEILKSSNPRRARNEKWLRDEHNRSFPNWIRDEVMREIQEGQVVSTTIKWIAHGLHPVVMIYKGYKVNGICYNTKPRGPSLEKQARLEAGCSNVPSTEGVINKGKGTCGPTGMFEIVRVSCDGHKRVVEYNELGQPIGESATKLKSFIGTTVRVHVPISYQSWKDVPTELKDKIYELIEKASTSNGELIDRGLVWKKARTTKDER